MGVSFFRHFGLRGTLYDKWPSKGTKSEINCRFNRSPMRMRTPYRYHNLANVFDSVALHKYTPQDVHTYNNIFPRMLAQVVIIP